MKIADQIYQKFNSGHKQLFLLADPDKFNAEILDSVEFKSISDHVDLFLLGGSLLSASSVEKTASTLRSKCNIPVVLFPGRSMQLVENVDAVLFLSLISGRNPEYLIGQHVQAAPFLYHNDIETIPTGYMLIDGGKMTSVQYISHSLPIPADKTDIAVATALAGKYLGQKLLYMEAGSGAENSVPVEMISAVAKATALPIIVGGGIRTAEKANEIYAAGAAAVVIGTAFEDNPSGIEEIIKSIQK
jgi:putative glycerol-1-phosphate prenyltransferase